MLFGEPGFEDIIEALIDLEVFIYKHLRKTCIALTIGLHLLEFVTDGLKLSFGNYHGKSKR